jgi:hypothetical protein
MVRQPSLAGMWYAGRAEALLRDLEDCFRHRLGPGEQPPRPPIRPPASRRTVGVVSPHAGMQYSGPCAAHGYLAVAKEGIPEVILVVGPNHGRLNRMNAVQTSGAWATPLGNATIHEPVARQIVGACDFLEDSAAAHDEENSIELQVPFLQYCFADELRWVPVMMADQSLATARRLGEAVATAVAGLDAVIVASSDFTHEFAGGDARRDDPKVIEPILALDAEGMESARRRHNVSMCGYGPIAAMLTATRLLGAEAAQLLRHYTSADLVGPHGGAVGYASIAVTR